LPPTGYVSFVPTQVKIVNRPVPRIRRWLVEIDREDAA
jgi:hypothetical protein